jgi:HK97 family phage prohead protease
VLLKDGASPDGVFNFTVSDGSVDRMGDTINPNGWRLDAFRKNPVVLFAHDSTSLPVGRAVDVHPDGTRLVASIKFAQTAMGRSVAGLVRGGYLGATSVGFVPLEYAFSKDQNRKGGIDFASTELLEISVVPVPANANALLTGISEGAGKAAHGDAKRKRERDLEVIRLRLPPLSAREQRVADVAQMKARTT